MPDGTGAFLGAFLMVTWPTPSGAPGTQAYNCFWCYTNPRIGRPVAWYGPERAGAFIRVCHTDLKIRLPPSGSHLVVQEDYVLA